MNYKTYLFDFDYTLADSSRGIVTCFRNVLNRHQYTNVTDEAIKHTIGKTLEESFSILTGVTDWEQLTAFRQEYRQEADVHMNVNTRLFPDTLSTLKELKERLYELEPAAATGQKENPFLDMISEEMLRSVQDAYNYSGIYISYSLSSSTNALKVEPYLITTSENNDYVKVIHMSAYNTTHFGTGIFSNHQNSYIMFNERESPQMALFTIYLQLPMYDFPHMLKGLYLCLDYNRNPIARRIIFIKYSDSTNMDDFLELKGAIIPKEELTEEQIPYYNYTCQPGDYIKTCSVPSPLLNEKDLEREKKMLEI
mgnify:CR=1 FL=1